MLYKLTVGASSLPRNFPIFIEQFILFHGVTNYKACDVLNSMSIQFYSKYQRRHLALQQNISYCQF